MAEWVGREILPHERDLRIWLQRRFVAASDVEDIVQECYCRLAQITDLSRIEQPRAYLFTIARNLAQQQRKNASVVRLETLSDGMDEQMESAPGPDRIAAARQELARLHAAVATLPERARRIFMMRKVEGLSQKEIASRLGVSETVVENDASRGLRAVLRLMTEPGQEELPLSTRGGRRARSH